jgi:hypothetical protein
MKENELLKRKLGLGFKSLLLAACLALGNANGWGETKTITITLTSAGGTANLGSNSYGGTGSSDRPERTWDQDGVSFGGKVIKGGTSSYTGTIQAQANDGRIYNTSPMPGKILSITTNQSGGASTCYGGDSRLVNSTAGNYTVSGTQVGESSTTGWDFTGTEYLYFAIKRGSSIAYFTSIEITYEEESVPSCATSLTWNGSQSSLWNTQGNWTPAQQPSALTDVIIPGNLESPHPYPELTGNIADNNANNVTFEPGAELGNQHLLTLAGEATVQYDLAGERWHLLSIPVDAATTGDFYFTDRYTFISEFTEVDGKARWKSILPTTVDLPLGKGFAFYAYDELHGGKYGSSPFNEIIPVSGDLAGDSHTGSLLFGGDSQYGTSPFALAANPFMTTINFDNLATANTGVITGNYLIWTAGATTYSGYTADGIYGVVGGITGTAGSYIAPLQSFIVQRSSPFTDNDGDSNDATANLIYNLAAIQATGQGTLRSSVDPVDKLDITATTPAGSVLTFIADREGGQSVLSDRDARKLFADVSTVPDIYTLKASPEGLLTAVGANVIRTDDITVPLGIVTNYKGQINFTFRGMDKYDAKITFIDNGEEIALTGLESYSYDFTLETAGVPVENRFAIRLAPANPNGLNKSDVSQAQVYCKNRTIFASSGSSDKIREIQIFNAQGQLIYRNDRLNTSYYTVNQYIQPAEVYVVKLITERGVKNVKVVNE